MWCREILTYEHSRLQVPETIGERSNQDETGRLTPSCEPRNKIPWFTRRGKHSHSIVLREVSQNPNHGGKHDIWIQRRHGKFQNNTSGIPNEKKSSPGRFYTHGQGNHVSLWNTCCIRSGKEKKRLGKGTTYCPLSMERVLPHGRTITKTRSRP